MPKEERIYSITYLTGSFSVSFFFFFFSWENWFPAKQFLIKEQTGYSVYLLKQECWL